MKPIIEGMITLQDFLIAMKDLGGRDDLQVLICQSEREEATIYFELGGGSELLRNLTYNPRIHTMHLVDRSMDCNLHLPEPDQIQVKTIPESGSFGIIADYSLVYAHICIEILISFPRGETMERRAANR